MSELISLGIRLEKKMINELNQIAEEEHVDRTTVIRKLISEAIQNHIRDKVLQKYELGKISISKAADDTGLTIGEIEEYMVKKGYRSIYSTADLEREIELLMA